MTKVGVLAVILSSGLWTGCAVDGDGGTEDTPDIVETPRIGLNALSPAALATSQLTTGKLDSAHATAMAPNSYAAGVLSYAVSCALAATQSITFTVGSTSYTYQGAFGIATAWTSRALTTSEAAWISACIIARVNLTSTSVTISARGAQTGYATTSAELNDYKVEEGAFWGNAFTDQGALVQYACNGADQARNDSYGDLPLRQCAQPSAAPGVTPCGFNYAGLCSDVCSSTNTYGGCAFNGGTASAQVVTAFLYGTPQ